MRLKLQDHPREWQKFAMAATLFFSLISGYLWRRTLLSDLGLQCVLGFLAPLLFTALLRPRMFRPFYRGAMRYSHAVGQVVGRILLVLCFVFLLTPLAILLRMTGRDLLQLRRDPIAQTYWKKARAGRHHDRAF